MPDMTRPKPALKPPMFPGPLKVVMLIAVAAVPYPLIISMDMRRIWMTSSVPKITALLPTAILRIMILTATFLPTVLLPASSTAGRSRSGAVSRDVTAAKISVCLPVLLSSASLALGRLQKHGYRKQQNHSPKSKTTSQSDLPFRMPKNLPLAPYHSRAVLLIL